MAAEPILFTGQQLRGPNPQFQEFSFVLERDDLPPSITWGRKPRQVITRYTNHTSLQRLGSELVPMELVGVFDAAEMGDANHAKRQRALIERMIEGAGVVKVEYRDDVLWGTLEASFEELRRDFIRYRLSFIPLWEDDPFEFSAPIIDLSPGEQGDDLEFQVQTTLEFFEDAPALDTTFLSTLLLELRRAQANIASGIGQIATFASYAEITQGALALAVRQLTGAHAAMQRAVLRLATASVELLAPANSPAVVIAGGVFVFDGQRQIRAVQKDLLETIRELLRSRSPLGTRSYTVREGDTLQRIAAAELGDFSRWTEIADANSLETTQLTIGQQLVLP